MINRHYDNVAEGACRSANVLVHKGVDPRKSQLAEIIQSKPPSIMIHHTVIDMFNTS